MNDVFDEVLEKSRFIIRMARIISQILCQVLAAFPFPIPHFNIQFIYCRWGFLGLTPLCFPPYQFSYIF